MFSSRTAQPLVLFCAKKRQTKRFLSQLGATDFPLIWITERDQIAPRTQEGDFHQFAEPTVGSKALLVDQITLWQPALTFFDLDHHALPWQEWMPLLKSVPASRRFPVIAFANRCDARISALGHRYGADDVLSWKEVSAHAARIVKEYARVPDFSAIEAFCQRPLSPYAEKGIALFNRGLYFEAHEALEEALKLETSTQGELYRAILQVAVAYLQIRRKNYRGALKMFMRLRQWLYPLPERCQGVDVAALRMDVAQAYRHLRALGAERMDAFDLELLRPVRLLTD